MHSEGYSTWSVCVSVRPLVSHALVHGKQEIRAVYFFLVSVSFLLIAKLNPSGPLDLFASTKYVHVYALSLHNGKITCDLNRACAAGSHEFTQIRCAHEFYDLRYNTCTCVH